MFYCESCSNKYGYPTDWYIPQSYGPCEFCGRTKPCYDTPSIHLTSKNDTNQKQESQKEDPNYK